MHTTKLSPVRRVKIRGKALHIFTFGSSNKNDFISRFLKIDSAEVHHLTI
jgi:hypothetical protein